MEAMLILVAGAVGLGFFLIFLLATADKKKRRESETELLPENSLTPERFQRICLSLVEGMKLEIDEIHPLGDRQVDVWARSLTPITGGRFLIQCLYLRPNEVVGAPEILELSNTIVQERLSKGIYITTGRFTEDLPAIGELAPIEFIDGTMFWELVKKYCPDYKKLR